VPQAAWHSGEEPAGEARAVEELWGDAWAGEEQEVDGGGQGRRTAPATGETEETEQKSRCSGRKKKGEGVQGLICKTKEVQGPHRKERFSANLEV
jgi:hypothetical protein